MGETRGEGDGHFQEGVRIARDVLSAPAAEIVGLLASYSAHDGALMHRDDSLLANLLSTTMPNGNRETFEAILKFHEGDRRLYLGYRDLVKLHLKAVENSIDYASAPLEALRSEMETAFEAVGWFKLFLDAINSFPHPVDRVLDMFELAIRSPNRARHLDEMCRSDTLVAWLARSNANVLSYGMRLAGAVYGNVDADVVTPLLFGIEKRVMKERERLEVQEFATKTYNGLIRMAEKFDTPVSALTGAFVTKIVKAGITDEMENPARAKAKSKR